MDIDLTKLFKELDKHFLEYITEHGRVPNSAGFITCINPNHPDRNPSMHLIDSGEHANTAAYCFSCNSHVSILNACHYLEQRPITGVAFYEDTLPYLCKKYDIPYEPIHIDNKTRDLYQKRCGVRDSLNIIHGMAFNGPKLNTTHPGIQHLLERGITEDTIKKFKIGVVSSYKEYLDKMNSIGYTDHEWLASADLANKGIFNPESFIIPIMDDKGRPVGFVSRTTTLAPNGKGQSKYRNSINSDIYSKGEILFNFNNYEPSNGPLWIVEGYVDAMYLAQAGLKNVAALGSTALTEQHVDLLSNKSVKNIILMLDADDGGRKGTDLAIERTSIYQTFKSIRIVELPEGYDPDSFVREQGIEELRKLSSPDIAISPFAWTLKKVTFQDDPIAVVEATIPTIANEESAITRLKMIKELAKITGISAAEIRKDVDLRVNKESSKFIEDLTEINKYVQAALNKKKVKDTKSILEESLFKIKNIELKYDSIIDNHSSYENKRTNLWAKMQNGEFKYGLYCPKFKKFEEMYDGVPFSTNFTLVGGRPSAGKCLKAGTKVLMFDGSTKKIEDVKINDELMGPDSTARRVLTLGSGEEEMYDIIPKRGMSWGCNSSHILSLRMNSSNGFVYKKNDIINIPIKDYLLKNNKFKHHAKQYKIGWELPEQNIKYDPYWIGSWLGDGSYENNRITICEKDLNELRSYYQDFAKNNNMIMVEKYPKNRTSYISFKNIKRTKINNINKFLNNNTKINNEKRIPKEYLFNSTKNRLEILAGLLDTDGHLIRKKGHIFEITTKYKGLKDDILYLGNSLGFMTTFSEKHIVFNNKNLMYYRIHISGDIHRIPTKLKRKQVINTKSRTNHQNVGFDIKPIGNGKYYGVTIDKDNLFLLEDGTVTHNTTWLNALAVDIAEANEDAAVFFMTIDDTTELMTFKMLAQKTGYTTTKIKQYIQLLDHEQEIIRDAWNWLENLSKTFVMADATEGTTPEVMNAHIEWFVKEYPNKKKIFFLDNFHKLTLPANKQKTDAVGFLSEKIKESTRLHDIHIITTAELRKLDNESRPSPADLKDSVQLEYDADSIIMVHNDKLGKPETNIIWNNNGMAMPMLELQIWKNKHTGKTGKLAYRLNSNNLQITEDNYSYVQALLSQNSGHQKIRASSSY